MVDRVGESLRLPYYTADMVRALPDDGNRYEVVHGELLVTPAPRRWHQVIVGRLVFALTQYVLAYRSGEVFASPADVSWGPDVLVQPDVFVVPPVQGGARVRELEWSDISELLLVAEVLSPATSRYDRFIKRRRYQEAAVPLYWIIDGDAEQVEVWTPADPFPRIERERLTWQPVGAAEPFVLPLSALFRPT